MLQTTRTEILPHVFLTHVPMETSKSARLTVQFLTQLDPETAALNALLPRVLLRGTVKHSTMRALSYAKEEMYGAKILPQVRKFGEIHAVGLYANFIDDRYLPGDTRVLQEMIGQLGEILLNPALEDEVFNSEFVASERQNLVDEIHGKINNKDRYAITRLIEQMCADEPFSTYKLGDAQRAANIEADGLTDHYRTLLASAPMEIFYSGTAPSDVVETLLKSALFTLQRTSPNLTLGTGVREHPIEGKPRKFTETQDVAQGKLSLGFRIGEYMANPNYVALELFHYLYGGSVNSRLFLHVREKLSLCYYASSILEPHKGLLLVASGIDVEKHDAAKGEILAQLDALCRGDFTDEELDFAKRAMMTDIRALADEPDSFEHFSLSVTLLGEDPDLLAYIRATEAISRETIQKIAQSLVLDAQYFLTGEKAQEKANVEVTV